MWRLRRQSHLFLYDLARQPAQLFSNICGWPPRLGKPLGNLLAAPQKKAYYVTGDGRGESRVSLRESSMPK